MWELSSRECTNELQAEIHRLHASLSKQTEKDNRKFFFGNLAFGEPYRYIIAVRCPALVQA